MHKAGSMGKIPEGSTYMIVHQYSNCKTSVIGFIFHQTGLNECNIHIISCNRKRIISNSMHFVILHGILYFRLYLGIGGNIQLTLIHGTHDWRKPKCGKANCYYYRRYNHHFFFLDRMIYSTPEYL